MKRVPLLFHGVGLFLLVTVAGCGGGGGGGGSPNIRPSPPPPSYSLILGTAVSVQGVTEAAQLAGQPPRITASTTGTASGQLSSDFNGNITSVRLVVSVPSLGFDETFAPTAKQTIDGVPGASFYVQAKPASDGSVRSLLLLDPRSAGLSYSTLGVWTHQPATSSIPDHAGVLVVGAETRPSDIPKTGSANYSGLMTGIYTDKDKLWRVGASAAAVADFGTRTVELTTTGSHRVDLNAPATAPVPDSQLDITGTLTYDAGRNVLETSGSFRTANMPTGSARGRFFGPAAAELGGSFFVRNGTSTGSSDKQMSGGFLLKK